MERSPAYGQLQKILEFSVDFASIERPQDGAEVITVAFVRPAKLTSENKAGMPYFRTGDDGPVEAVDIGELSCLIACIPVPRLSSDPGKTMQAVYERPRVMRGEELDDDNDDN